MLNVIDFDGTTGGEWSRPDLEEWGYGSEWDSLSKDKKLEVADNFLVTVGDEFPPEDFGDLKLPVVEPVDELLNKSAVDNADARLNQTDGVTKKEMENLQKQINAMQRKHFKEHLE